MPIRLDVTLLSGRYDAGGGDNPRVAEWPPHPAKIFAALRSVAQDDELGSLRQLEGLAPPLVHASHAESSRSEGYVVVNSLKRKRTIYPARWANYWQRVRSLPVEARVQYDWGGDEGLPDSCVKELDRLAQRVPYLGRSTSPASLVFSRVVNTAPLPGLTTYEPVEGYTGTMSMRVPFPGYIDELNALYKANQPAWSVNRTRLHCDYREVGSKKTAEPGVPVASPYPDLVVLRFVGRRPPGNLVRLFTEALRKKVMGQTEEPLPPALHGHGLPGHPHVAYLGLPYAGFEHADGQLMALAVAIPGLERAERRRILRGIFSSDDLRVHLWVSGFRDPFELEYAPQDPLPKSATAERWAGPAQTWVSVTPLVLDRFPKDGDVATTVAASFSKAGLPIPRRVDVSNEPLTNGAIRLKPHELPKRCQGRLFRHVRVTFDQPIRGPVLAGAGRYFGVGFFAPE